MDLSYRLETVARAVSPGRRVADVGTDHAYIPIYLVEEGIIREAIASDINPGPLERAAQNIRAHGLEERIRVRLGSGLKPIEPEEADCVVIAGMGGDLMRRILLQGQVFFEKGTEFVLQPQSEWFKVRKLLHDQGYRIDREWMIREDGHDYVVIRALPGEETYPREESYLYGEVLIREKNRVLMDYLERHYKKKDGILKDLEKRNRTSLDKRIRELRRDRDMIGSLLEEMKRS